MAKLVAETAAGRSIRALVILNEKGEEVAKVHAHYSNSGRVTVDVFNFPGAYLQQGVATGHGYDKFTAAIRGLVIDGHEILDHSGLDRLRGLGYRVISVL